MTCVGEVGGLLDFCIHLLTRNKVGWEASQSLGTSRGPCCRSLAYLAHFVIFYESCLDSNRRAALTATSL